MGKVIIRLLDPIVAGYLKSQIETGDPLRTKRALQEICKHYRAGFRCPPAQLAGLEQSVVGLLYTQSGNEKVRRWALNALARLGREPQCLEAVLHTLENYEHEPQTSAAAIAAIFRMSRKATIILKRLSFDEQMVTLAALQHVDARKLDLSSFPVNIENASPDLLKLALVVVGLDRAPPNMLHPRHENASLVKALGGHHDNVVTQYTVWAITENPSLNLDDIGIDIQLVEQQPENVRGWIFRLIAMTPEDAERNFEYIELGSRDPSAEARMGLAVGLKETYFDGLEALVLDWFLSEEETEIRQRLIEHMILQADECPSYEQMVIEIYEKEPPRSAFRIRMEAAAAGRRLYSKLRRTDIADLFGEGITNVTSNKTYNITGGIHGGAVSIGGDAANLGNVQFGEGTLVQIQSELSKLERVVHESEIRAETKGQLLDAVRSAKSDPSPTKVWTLVSAIRKTGEIVLAGTTIWEIGQVLATLAGVV